MNSEKITQVNNELKQFDDIIDKLNFWRKNYLDKYPGDALHEYFETKSAEQLESNYSDGFSGVISIPSSGKTNRDLLPDFFKIGRSPSPSINLKYYRWELYYIAEKRFINKKPYYEKEISKPLGKEKITGIIKKTKKIIKNALALLKRGEIDIEKYADITDEKLYLWYKQDFYSSNYIWMNQIEQHYDPVMRFHYLLPYLQELIKINEQDINPIKIKNIDIGKLLANLKYKSYYDDSEQENIKNWFNGISISKTINLTKPMNHFVSIIANLKDRRFIENTKNEIAIHINHKFLFNNKPSTQSSILQVMRPSSRSRLHEQDEENFFAIDDYILK